MRLIKITFKDGTTKEFRFEGRTGGSRKQLMNLEFKNGWVIVTDEYGHQYFFAQDSIKEIEQRRDT